MPPLSSSSSKLSIPPPSPSYSALSLTPSQPPSQPPSQGPCPLSQCISHWEFECDKSRDKR
eukprot:3470199-Rhodomonas_salina.1